MPADTILHNAKIATNSIPSFVDALAITDGKITATGNDPDIFRLRAPVTKVIDANRRTVIPGLNDSHMHPIRAGLSYNMDLRWEDSLISPAMIHAYRLEHDACVPMIAIQWQGFDLVKRRSMMRIMARRIKAATVLP